MVKHCDWIRSACLAVVLILPQQAARSQHHPDYENPQVFERNQEAPHATLMPYASLDEALNGERKSSTFHFSLNGTWKFLWSENPSSAPGRFFEDDFLRADWDKIRVPSNWQMEGYGYPLFRNIGLPHPLDPPEVPHDFNPVGSYYRTFTLPEEWEQRRILLHFEGVHSASYVWINGKEVGYNQGGMEPAEYDITNFLKEGENSIAVRVLRYSDGAYMEDQDTWRLSGIYRDVYLIAVPGVHIQDFYVITDLDESYRDALLKVDSRVRNYRKRPAEGYLVRASLYRNGSKVAMEGEPERSAERMTGGQSCQVVHMLNVDDPDKWSAEYPNLYVLVLELLGWDGRVEEILSTRVGFREVEIIDQAICINGVAIKFNGVNSHMLHPLTGHAMDLETMRKDLTLMKQFNINCVRTSHYPPNIEYLDLADELGIYLVDETGDEAHAYMQISDQPEWREQYLDRMRKMVYRDRNHPSVVMWSAGNESGSGENICALIEEGKRVDPSRPGWMYGGNRDEDPATYPISCEDIVGPRYLQPFLLEARFGKSTDPRPSFMDEYIAATGNSLGGLDMYWDLIYRYRRLTGGAIWDWPSPGIVRPVILTDDDSPYHVTCALMNKAHLVQGENGFALYLSGHDDWLEIYRDPALDVTGHSLSLSFYVRPEPYNGNAAYLTKGDYQYGIIQNDENSLEFYLNAGRRTSVTGKLPEDWIHRWHHVAGIYDGNKMELYIDGHIAATGNCKGDIRNSPYGVVLGKSAELRDSHRGYLCHATLDRVRIFDRALPVAELKSDPDHLKEDALLWLDFETSREKGTYYSIGLPGRTYGLIWPDRSIQPELWQLKKSPQPVAFYPVDPEAGIIGIWNRYHFTDLKERSLDWQLTADGEVLQEGRLDQELAPGEKAQLHIHFQKPVVRSGTTCHLLLLCTTRKDQPWAKRGHEVAWEQFELDFSRSAASEAGSATTGSTTTGSTAVRAVPEAPAIPVELKDEGDTVSVSGVGFEYLFGRREGTLISMKVDGSELIACGPRLNVWRAPLANDLDSWNYRRTELGFNREWMGRETANGWRSIGLDRLEHVVDRFICYLEDGRAVIKIESSLHANNYTTGFKVIYQYQVTGDGHIELSTQVSPRGRMTRWIPKVGLQLNLPKRFQDIEWFGRGPFETYPDRKTGARVGKYHTTVEADYVPYIIPQDYGNKTDVRWFSISDGSGSGLLVRGDGPFNASAQKYSTDNLDRAHYTFQLKEDETVTLNLDHRVTGVGGTANSVLNPFQVMPDEYAFTFSLEPLR